MNVDRRQHLFARCQRERAPGNLSLDIGAFAERLLTFERYTLWSRQCQELREIALLLGTKETSRLLESGALAIYDQSLSAGSLSRDYPTRPRPLPPLHYTIHLITESSAPGTHDPCESMIRTHLAKVTFPGLEYRETRRLKSLVQSVAITDGVAGDFVGSAKLDILERTDLLKAAVREKFRLEKQPLPDDFEISVSGENTLQDPLRVKTTLPIQLGKRPEQLHGLLEHALLAVTRVNQELAYMSGMNATTELAPSDIEFFQLKITDVVERQAGRVSSQLSRVLSLAGLPDIRLAAEQGKVDFKKLLLVRDSDEAREFREWLLHVDTTSESDLAALVGGLRNRVIPFLTSKPAKMLSILTASAITLPFSGPFASLVAGAAVGGLQTFVIDKLLAAPGPVIFVNGKLRSLFDVE